MNRRVFVSTVSSVAFAGLAGCMSGSGGDIDSVEYDGQMLVVSLEEGHDVDELQILYEDGSDLGTERVGTETRVELMDFVAGGDVFPSMATDRGEYVGETFTIRAIDSEGDSAGEVEVEYQPELEAEDFDVDFEDGEIEFTVSNVGTGPVFFEPDVQFSETEEVAPDIDSVRTPTHIMEDPPMDFPMHRIGSGDEIILNGGESTEVAISTEPLINYRETSEDGEPRPNEDISSRIIQRRDDPIETDKIPVDKTEVDAVLEVKLESPTSVLSKSYQAEVEFTDIVGLRSESEQVTLRIQYDYQPEAQDAEIGEFELVEEES